MLGSRPLCRTTAFAPRRDSRREKPFHQELPALFVASPNHNPKLPILSISYPSRFRPLVPLSSSRTRPAFVLPYPSRFRPPGDPHRTKQIRNDSSRGQRAVKPNFAACHPPATIECTGQALKTTEMAKPSMGEPADGSRPGILCSLKLRTAGRQFDGQAAAPVQAVNQPIRHDSVEGGLL